MSQENVERFLASAEATHRGDFEAALEAFDRDVVFETQAAAMEGVSAGLGGVRTFMLDLNDLYEDVQVHYSDVRDLGDQLLALGTMRTIGKGSGIEQETPLAIVANFRDGRITHFKDFGDKDQAFEAVGLSE